jgi:photosystem II stability/assembly factor-like uncharacterized protein
MRLADCCLVAVCAFTWCAPLPTAAQETADSGPEEDSKLNAGTLSGLAFRGIGPAYMSGRIGDLAVNPADHTHFYVAVCSGGVWKTTNAGTTFTPIFDDQGSYSIGCLALDPHNPHVLWVGTGENNSQRSVSFGDGVYVTRDGGKNWENVGLPESEHIGMITIDPRDSNVVYVAAQGPLWRDGGDRGLYKTTDGGKTWERILHVDDQTGANEIHLDPRDPDTLYCSTYQRRRRVWTLINGGPGSGLYKSTDAGKTWRELTKGLPEVDMGRIGLDLSPVNPDILYAIVEASQEKGGIYRSLDRGETWEKRSDYMANSPQYYCELVCSPVDPDHVYSLDTFTHETLDGGGTWSRIPRDDRHVDDHALWINPQNPKHMRIGGDGGLYETFDQGANWRFFPNLPVTQFYRVAIDNAEPFYNIYGGTQDNKTQGGPTRTTDRIGIANEHWFSVVGGDGYEAQVDPMDPMIVYAQWQYGGLVRHDRRSGQIVNIKPREEPGEAPFKWNWDTPLLLSPHDHKRLYTAANRVFRSDDRGNSWQRISPDLTRGLDRNQLEVMGKIQSVDAVSKHRSTSFYGNCVALDESPLVSGLLYVGTDDGLVQVTEDGGANWRKVASFPGIPELTYVSDLCASRHDDGVVYATFDNRKSGDFTPYVLKSTDRGRSWFSVRGDLPDREVVYTIVEDHEQPHLLFVGTEFGVYATLDGGAHWHRLKGGIPTICVRDLEIQRRENDLVAGTFGRGFYILDDYTPLRKMSEELLQDSEAVLWPVKDAWRYIQRSRLGGRNGRGSQGATFFAAPNPPFGAIFTYYLRDKIETRQEARRAAEKKAAEEDKTPPYPTLAERRAEHDEDEPQVMLVVRDSTDNVVRRVPAARDAGLHRTAWNLRYPTSTPITLSEPEDPAPWWEPPSGPLANPGTYQATLELLQDGKWRKLAGPESFVVKPLELATFEASDRDDVLAFKQDVARLRRAVQAAMRVVDETRDRITHLQKAVIETPAADPTWSAKLDGLAARLRSLRIALRGDPVRSEHEEPQVPSIDQRVEWIVGNLWSVTSPPTRTQLDGFDYAATAFAEVLGKLRVLVEEDLPALEARFEEAGAPYTPGRLPDWQPE